ncbi:MAG TPA: 16S rRNA (cytosine(1402)-N(4))-methyltransferase RsmH [Burkholderiaceae bacterium]|nr:16S rRNA (cytosine(1402)-N(4))-methyltransferase RsmH [Burkholderiaceae bacterium]
MTVFNNHTTVLLSEAVEALCTNPDETYIDGTFGRGGHTQLLLTKLSAHGRVIAFDKDPDAVSVAKSIGDTRLSIRHEGFKNICELPDSSVAGVLLDLGISSPQIDNPERGFSFRFEAPLDMRMDTTRGISVAQWLERADVNQITEVIREYGEERFASAIAKAIITRRQERGAISTTTELAQLVADTVKTRESGQNPATRTFQAFRIYINAELEELQQALNASLNVIKPGGRLVVISFHSLEDRIVKQFIAEHSKDVYDRRMPLSLPKNTKLKALGRVKPCMSEISRNPRSRSAVMRIAERLAA